jgi:ubiquitin-activating enzyme E1
MIEEKPAYNENLYSRQIGVFGAETMGKLVKLRVFIQGLKGIGIETAKNLILAGPKTVTLFDQETVSISDLGSNFYLKESDVGQKTRGEASLKDLTDLNEYVEVKLHTGEINTDFISNFDVVCFTDCYDKEYLIKINEFCRKREKPIGFIWSGCLGLFGWTFVDFGDAHMVFDKDGEECLSTIITSISNDAKSVVTVNDDKRHGFQDGDWVTFREVEGMTEVNDKKFKINVISPFSFSIGDTTAFSKYTRQGIAEQVKVPYPVKFKSLADAFENPLAEGETVMIDADVDYENMSKPYQYHFLLKQVLEWFKQHKRLPGLLDEKDATDFETRCNEQLQTLKSGMKEEGKNSNPANQIETLPALLAKRLALFGRCHLTPFTSFWGGIVAQEIVKYTGKFNPIRPWFYYENYNFVLPENDTIKREVQEKSRYRDQIAIIGKEAHEKLEKTKLFMVGAGALGCEYMKLFALMGIGCGGGKVEVTDDDNIELSNLNRQFLFRREHVGESKSKTAGKVAQGMNNTLNVVTHKNRVAPENENIFTDIFWDGVDFVVGAVDNIKARQYVDSKCVFHTKPLFESGTLGTKCNSQVIIPNVTESYGDSQDPAEEGIPLCTLRNYPYLLDHTIEWARNYFQAQFVDGSIDFANYMKDPAKYIKTEKDAAAKKAGSLKDKLEVLKKILQIQKEGKTPQAFVNFARQLFQDIFHDQIAQLLHAFPRDYKDDKGNLFWSSPKRPPYVIDFDSNDEMHFMFIRSICQIMATSFGIKFEQTDSQLKSLISQARFTVNKPIEKTIKKDDKDTAPEAGANDEEVLNALAAELSQTQPDQATKVHPIEFEKDDDANGHIDFMTSTSNLRARNYKIPEAPRHKIKIIAGKIIPAIATTTAMIVGAVGLEIYKYLFDKKIEHRRNAFMNLALPLFVFSEPMPPIFNTDKEMDPILFVPVKAVPAKWTNWMKIDIRGPNKTIRQVLDTLRSEHKLEVNMIILGKRPFFNEMQADHKDRLGKTVEEVYKLVEGKDTYPGQRYIPFILSATTLEGDEASCPIMRYILN